MKINRKLNLVYPLDRGDDGIIYVHAEAIRRETFERYFATIARAYAATWALSAIAGPQVAYLMIKKFAIDANEWEGEEGVERGLIREIVRLSNVILPGPNGWQYFPLENVISAGKLDEEEAANVLNVLCFFTLISSMQPKGNRASVLGGMASLWGTQTTLWDVTGYLSSLQTSTPSEPIGGKAIASSIPS